MPTPQKEQIINEMTEKFDKASSVYLMDFTGMDVNTTTNMRKKFREEQVDYRVVKNTLARISVKKAGIEGLTEYISGVNGYVLSYDDPTKPAKLIDKNKEIKEKVKVKAVLFEGKIFGPDQVEDISKLPSRDELLGQLVGMLSSPMTKLASTLNGAMSGMVNVLKSLEEKKK